MVSLHSSKPISFFLCCGFCRFSESCVFLGKSPIISGTNKDGELKVLLLVTGHLLFVWAYYCIILMIFLYLRRFFMQIVYQIYGLFIFLILL